MGLKLEALHKWVIVEPESSPDTSPGGILLPDTMKEGYVHVGTIVSAGPKLEDKRLKKGVRVTYQSFIDNEVLKERLKKRTLAIKEEDLVAIVTDGDEED